MKKIKKDGKEYAVITKTIEEYIDIEEVKEQIKSVEAMIVATQNTLNDYISKKEQLEKYV
jgi:hypothetical protein